MSRPLIGITVGSDVRTSKYRPYQAALEAAGGFAVLVPPTATPGDVLERVDGLLLPGGADVDWRRYADRDEGTEEPDLARDELEIELVRRAELPILAICRGIQVVNVALGGTLVQHLEGHRDPAARHEIRLEDGTVQTVNSRHHQAVKDVAPTLRVTATSADGVIEGLASADGRISAVQCHPEDLVDELPWARSLFESFVAQAGGSLASASSTSSRLRA